MLKKFTVVVAALMMVAGAAQADEYLNADQTRALFSGKTFDGAFVKKGKVSKFWAFEDPNGDHLVMRRNGKIDGDNRKWSVTEDGRHCTTSAKWPDPRCSRVKDLGNGTIIKVNDKGKKTHTLTNFRDGNQLDAIKATF